MDGEYLAALGAAAAPIEGTLTEIIALITVARDLEKEKADPASLDPRSLTADQNFARIAEEIRTNPDWRAFLAGEFTKDMPALR